MVSTISLDELSKQGGSIYEAIVVIAKRARQVNDEQKRYIEQELGFDEMTGANDDIDDDEFREERSDRKVIKLPKPPTVSLDEILAGKLNFEYAEDPSSPS